MSSKPKIKITKGIRHYEDVDIAGLPEGADGDVANMRTVSKIRITTLIDTDILDELKKRAAKNGSGRYQTYLNQLLRDVLLGKRAIDEDRVKEIVRNLVKPSSLKRKSQ